MKAKPVERAEARRLRTGGTPMNQIARLLEVSVGSVHLWTADIELSEEQLRENRRLGAKVRNAAWAERHREVRRGYQEEGRLRARQGDPLHHAGCMLYWAEGSKERNTVLMANSDAHMLTFFRRFLTECFGLSPERFAFSLNVYLNNGLALAEIEHHWLAVLALPRTCLRKHVVDHLPTSSSGRRRNKLPYGVGRLRVNSTHIVQHIFGAIQEYAGFQEPRWLDGAPRRAG